MNPMQRAILESLEQRTLLTALYWDTSSAPGLQAGNGAWSTSAANWNTASDGSGSNVAWTDGSDAVFSTNGTSTVTISGTINANSLTAAGTGYTISGGTLNLASGGTSTIAAGLTLNNSFINNSGTLNWTGGNFNLTNSSALSNAGTINLDGGSDTLSQTGNWFGGGGTLNWSSGNANFSGVSLFTSNGTFDGGANTFTLDDGSSMDAWNLDWNSGDVSVDDLFIESGSWNFLNFDGGDSNWTVTGTFQYDGGFFNWTSGSLTLNNATITGTSSPFTLTVPDTATLNVTGTFALSNATVENSGTTNWNSADSMAGITNNSTLNFSGTDTTGLADLTNDGTVIFQDPVALVGLTGSSTATEGSAYSLTIGSVSSDIPDTITDYLVDWGDNVGFDDFTSAGTKTYTYGASATDTATRDINVHLVGQNGVYIASATMPVTVSNLVQAPTGLAATANGVNGIHLSWADNSSGETGYQVEIQWPGTNFETIADLPANTTSYDYTDYPTETMTFRVRAVGHDESAYSKDDSTLHPPTVTPNTSFMGDSTTKKLDFSDADPTTAYFSWEQDPDTVSTTLEIRKIGSGAGERKWYGVVYTGNGIASGATSVSIPWDRIDYPGGVQVAVLTQDSSGAKKISNMLTLTPPNSPSAPSDLAATIGSGGYYNFTWTPSGSGIGNVISDVGQKARPGNVSGQLLTTGSGAVTNGTPVDPATLYTDSGGTSGYYAMDAGSASGFGVSSHILDIATPNAPTDVTAKPAGSDGILVTWKETAFNAQNALVQRSNDGGTTWTTLSSSIDPNDGKYLDDTALPGVSYKYRVENTRTNAFGAVSSDWDTSAAVTPMSADRQNDYKIERTKGKISDPISVAPSGTATFDVKVTELATGLVTTTPNMLSTGSSAALTVTVTADAAKNVYHVSVTGTGVVKGGAYTLKSSLQNDPKTFIFLDVIGK